MPVGHAGSQEKLRIHQKAETKSRLGGAKTMTTASAGALAEAEQLTHIVSVRWS